MIINPNCYNPIRVCYDCLIEKIYTCDTELKYKVLKELIYITSIKKIQSWWIEKLYELWFISIIKLENNIYIKIFHIIC